MVALYMCRFYLVPRALLLLTNACPELKFYIWDQMPVHAANPDEAYQLSVEAIHFVTELPPLISFRNASSTSSDKSISRLIASIFAFFHNSGSTFIDVTSLFLCDVECFAFM
jgi:hypothetical protein